MLYISAHDLNDLIKTIAKFHREYKISKTSSDDYCTLLSMSIEFVLYVLNSKKNKYTRKIFNDI